MRIVIRTDSSKQIGGGHVIRCLTLAHELRACGAEVLFVCRELSGHLINKIEEANFQVYRLPMVSDASIFDKNNYSTWLSVTQEVDVNDTLFALGNQIFDWVVIDHYALNQAWERSIKHVAKNILVIDDLANRKHDCDILLDQNYFGEKTFARYENLVTEDCNCLLGPAYALVQPIYSQLRSILPSREGPIRRVVVFFGSSDSAEQTLNVLNALSYKDLLYLAVDVVIGANYPDSEYIKAIVSQRPGTTLYQNLPTLAGLFARADLVIGAGGSTTWERMCLGLPSLVMAVAENQMAFTQALSVDDYQVMVPGGLSPSSDDWYQAIIHLVKEPKEVLKLAKNSLKLVDGLGVKRIARFLIGGSMLLNIHMRQCSPIKKESDDEIYWSERKQNSLILIGEDDSGLPLGKVRFDICLEQVTVHVNSDKTLKSLCIDQLLLSNALRKWRSGELNNQVKLPMFTKLYKPDIVSQKSLNSLRITILCDQNTWLWDTIDKLQLQWLQDGHLVNWVYHPSELVPGDVCFILSCSNILKPEKMALNSYNLVVHAADLPEGRGWSPITWQILEDKSNICVTLFEAAADVDAGPIYNQHMLILDGTELADVWRKKLSDITYLLCTEWIDNYPESAKNPRQQSGDATYYSRRRPEHSRLDPDRTIREQFNLLRVVDNDRYPAFFDLYGQSYQLKVELVKQ